jgi:flagellar hook-associated protein 2
MGGFGTGINALDLSGTAFGLGQGLNVQSIVQSLTQAAEAGETQYTNEQTLYNSQISALTNVSNLLTSLQTATQTLQDPAGPLAARDANSSNSSVVTATASSGISTGDYSIVVNNLASTSTFTSQALTSGDTTFGTGAITLQVGSNAPVTINVDSTDNTLNGLESAINSGNYGLSANVITDDDGATLALSSTSGQAGQIYLISNTSGLNLSQAVPGQDASFSVNGVNVQTASNTVTGVIPGVTLNLTGTSSSAATISVTQDIGQATTAINNFVSAYNAVAQAINTQFTYTQGATSQPPLFSDSSLQQVQATLANDINYFISGNSGISGLSSVGVNLQQDGTLSVDTSTLTSALTSNAAAVQTLFQGPDYVSGFAGQLYNDINTLNDPTNGVIALDLQGINQEESDVTQTINDFNTNLAQQQQEWTTEYSLVNATLQELPLLIAQATGQAVNTGSSSSSSSSTEGTTA